jgi:succinyl-CoA synthetase beta subunit
MKLHEYQGKALLRKAGLPVPRGEVVFSSSEVPAALKALGGEHGVAKAQAFTGGRGKAGGIKVFNSAPEATASAEKLIGMTLVTHQTGADGVKIQAVLLEEQSKVARELYFAVTLDRAKANIVFILSPEGGMDITTASTSVFLSVLVTSKINFPSSNKILSPGFTSFGNSL